MGCRDAVKVLRLTVLVSRVRGGALQGRAAAAWLIQSHDTPASIPECPPAPMATSALRLSLVLPFKQSSLAVMACSHGDEQ